MRLFLFAMGLATGFVALTLLQGVGIMRPREPVRMRFAADRPERSSGRPTAGEARREAHLAELRRRLRDGGALFETLAVYCDEAIFDDDMAKVEAVATALREDASAHMSARPAPAPAAESKELPLVLAIRETERRAQEAALRARRNEATALAGRADRQAMTRLRELLEGAAEPIVRADAARMLVRAQDVDALRAVVEGLGSTDPLVRAAAAIALAEEGSLEGVAALARLLDEPRDSETLRDAARGLGRYDEVLTGAHHPATVALRKTLAEHHATEARAGAAEGMGTADLTLAEGLRAALVERLERDPEAEVRRACAAALAESAARFGAPPEVIAAAARRLALEPDRDARTALVTLLGQGDAASLLVLEGFAGTPEGREHGESLTATITALRTALEVQRR